MTISSLQVIAPSTALPGGPPGVQGPPGAFVVFAISNQTGVSYQASANDTGKLLIFTGQTINVTITFSPITQASGWWCIYKNGNISGQLVFTPTGGALIDGQTSMTLDPSCTAQFIWDGVNFDTFGPADGGTF